MNLDTILVPVDFSERSADATRQAAALARQFHSPLVLLYVSPLSRYMSGGLEGVYTPSADPTDWEKRELDTFLKDELSDLPVQRVRLEGDPARDIVRFARDKKVRLIVMPTHGYGPFRRFILGSVTAKVLHDTECPVWTGVHLEAPPAQQLAIRHVLCAIDLSPHSEHTLCWAAQIAAEFGARLTIVHATPQLEGDGFGTLSFAPEWREMLTNHITQQIADLQRDAGTEADVFVEAGDAPKAVRTVAETTRADLVVIGRSPSGGRLRTNAYGIIRESPCPVLSV